MYRIFNLFLALMILLVSGCASVPKEGSELSVELGKRISAIEQSHFALLDQFMSLKRAQVNDFIENEWLPEFARIYLNKPKIAAMWDAVNTGGDEKDKLEFFTIVSTDAQREIVKKRLELMKPLDEAERLIVKNLKNEYAQVRSMNSAISGLLASASEVDDARGAMLKTFNVKDEHLAKLVSGVEAAVSGLKKSEDAAGKARKASEKFDDFKSEINKVVDKLKKVK